MIPKINIGKEIIQCIKTEINVHSNPKSPQSADTNEMSFKCQFTGDVKTSA